MHFENIFLHILFLVKTKNNKHHITHAIVQYTNSSIKQLTLHFYNQTTNRNAHYRKICVFNKSNSQKSCFLEYKKIKNLV